LFILGPAVHSGPTIKTGVAAEPTGQALRPDMASDCQLSPEPEPRGP
jgi:hypothetical protein